MDKQERIPKRTLIVAGGELSPAFLQSYLASHEVEDLIAVDRGMDVLLQAKNVTMGTVPIVTFFPDLIVGDFDSTREKGPEAFREQGAEIEVYPREKDFSDLESALKAAIRRGSTEITVLGATGGRLDHFLANVMDLRIALEAGVPARIVNGQNVIYLADRSFAVEKRRAFGKYFSLLPLTGRVRHVSLSGFRYSGEDITFDQTASSYGISNEILEETAEVCFEEGILIVVESKDG